jgi:uncharacterized protein YuzE
MKRFISVFAGTFFGLVLSVMSISAQDNQTIKTVNGGVLNSKAISLPAPNYSPAAKAVNAGGTVSVEIIIDENGNVVSTKAVSGHPLLKNASENAAKQSQFAPTFLEGQPVKVTGVLVYNFSASDSESVNGGVLNSKTNSLPVSGFLKDVKGLGIAGGVNFEITEVDVEITVDEVGNVISAKAVSGNLSFSETAEKAAKQAKFAPKSLSGKTVKVIKVAIYSYIAPKEESK